MPLLDDDESLMTVEAFLDALVSLLARSLVRVRFCRRFLSLDISKRCHSHRDA